MRRWDLVASVRPMGLHCSHYVYDNAVVASMHPFVLVSQDGDMRWAKIQPEDVVVVGRVSWTTRLHVWMRFRNSRHQY